MTKKVKGYAKLQVAAGKANPSPPIGPTFGQHAVNIMGFFKGFNAKPQRWSAQKWRKVGMTISNSYCN